MAIPEKNKNKLAISIRNLTKKYRLYEQKIDRFKETFNPFVKRYHTDFYAVKNLSLDIPHGEILGIVGKNGAGKSTLLKLITGIIQPTEGEISRNGMIVPLLELGSGLNPLYTGLENIYFYNSLLGVSREETKKSIPDIVEFAEIEEFINQPLKTYSSGMKARLAFAVSININPDILILDEVLSVGDEMFKRKSFAKMQEFFESGKTIIYVSHSLSSISQLCSRAIMLDKGEIIQDGPPKMIAYNYQKLLFSKKNKYEKVRQELIDLNKSDEYKNNFLEEELDFSTLAQHEMQEEDHEAVNVYFIPDFTPKSTIEQKNAELEIFDFKFIDDTGNTVNVLQTGREYKFCYNVKFGADAENLAFTTVISDKKGIPVSGTNYSSKTPDKLCKKVRKGYTYAVQWSFICNLLTGTYYINIAILHITGIKKRPLYRARDIGVFKVEPFRHQEYKGVVYLNQQTSVSEAESPESLPKYLFTVSDKEKFIWFPNPKVGSSSIRMLIENLGFEFGTGRFKPYDLNKYQGYFKFAFLRNPWARLVSCYNDKVNGNDNKIKFYAACRGKDFAFFLDFLKDKDLTGVDRHVRLQSSLFPINELDCLGKIENFEQDIYTIFHDKLNLEIGNIPQINNSNSTDYREYYNDDQRQLIAELYKSDIELGEYEF